MEKNQINKIFGVVAAISIVALTTQFFVMLFNFVETLAMGKRTLSFSNAYFGVTIAVTITTCLVAAAAVTLAMIKLFKKEDNKKLNLAIFITNCVLAGLVVTCLVLSRAFVTMYTTSYGYKYPNTAEYTMYSALLLNFITILVGVCLLAVAMEILKPTFSYGKKEKKEEVKEVVAPAKETEKPVAKKAAVKTTKPATKAPATKTKSKTVVKSAPKAAPKTATKAAPKTTKK